MMTYILGGLVGYLLGSLSPAYFFSKRSHIDLRRHGTGNLGATNTALVLGKLRGILVMLFDISKAYGAALLCRLLFPELPLLPFVSGSAAVIGHIFPWYLSFKGGKGLACFAGLVLATDKQAFLWLLVLGCIVILITDYACTIAISSALLFPVISVVRHQSLLFFIVPALASAALLFRHAENIQRMRKGEEIRVRRFLKQHRRE